MIPALWQPVLAELAEWRAAGLTAQLWLRDDDAIEPTPKLDRLIALTADYDVPVGLAIIPSRTDSTLARRLDRAGHIHPLIHGWSHDNHAPAAEKKQELGQHRPRDDVLRDLSAALARLTELYSTRLTTMLVPPWNRIDETLLMDLPRLGFTGLSAFGHKLVSQAGLVVANAHIDIVDSRAGNACRDHGVLTASLAQELAMARKAGGRPVGILSHHLVSDDDAFRFLRDLFSAAAQSQAVRWHTPREIMARVASQPS
jgi:hypothetical protein